MLCYQNKNPQICKSQEHYHRSARLHINYGLLVSKKRPISANYGKT